jgi:thymidylate synthase
MRQYLDGIRYIFENGSQRGDRTGVGTLSVFSMKQTYDLRQGFPLVTSKKVRFDYIVEELVSFLSGNPDMPGIGIWDDWRVKEEISREVPMDNAERLTAWCELSDLKRPVAEAQLNGMGSVKAGHAFLDQQGVPRNKKEVLVAEGALNAPYGPAWRAWRGRNGQVYDQIDYLLTMLKTNPTSRRMVLSAWDPANMPDESISPQDNIIGGRPCLTPCHWAFELYTDEIPQEERIEWCKKNYPDRWDDIDTLLSYPEYTPSDDMDSLLGLHDVPKYYLDLKYHQRSCDYMVGVPYNIASYAVLQHMFATTANMIPRMLEADMTNVHIYSFHKENAIMQASRTPREMPTLKVLNQHSRLEDYTLDDFEITGYDPHPFIKYERAV